MPMSAFFFMTLSRAGVLILAPSISPIQRNLFSLHCLDFHAEDQLTPRWHEGKPCEKASWESLQGKPQIP